MAESNGTHDANGHFAAGNTLAKLKTGMTYRQARNVFRNAISDDDVAAIAKKQVELAKKGDANATKLVLAYKCGQPPKIADPIEVEEQTEESRKVAMEFM